MFSTVWTLLGLLSAVTAQVGKPLPIVDLGYTVQQATQFDSSAGFYNFSNIRYAAPPVGSLRFAPPQPPSRNRAVQKGSVGRICHQAAPAWILTESVFLPAYLSGNGSAFNASSGPVSPSSSAMSGAADPRETEDCLFLDVAVPQKIFERRYQGAGAPVLVWIHGGGYVFGEKSGAGSPAGLLARSQTGSTHGVIFVALNYRLGAFGWLSGPTLQANGTSNAGLLDQQLALKWVQQNILAFGGDPNRVTVFGESAGGGSIMHQMTAYGGNRPVPFQQVIPQSPGWQPITGKAEQEAVLQKFLAASRVKTVQEARGLPEATLALANAAVVGASPYGTFTFGPVVDGNFVPDLPGKLLLQGAFAKNLKVMVGHNANEGLLFTSPFIRNDSAYVAYVKESFPTAKPSVIDYITQTLYPPVFDGSYGYKDQIQRTALTAAESVFSCNTNYLGRAYGNQSYNYLFSIPPAIHGQDVPYSFYNGPNPLVIADPIAVALQEYLTGFAESGTPNEPGIVPQFNIYGQGSEVQNLNITGIEEIRDPTANARCLWWQQALYE